MDELNLRYSNAKAEIQGKFCLVTKKMNKNRELKIERNLIDGECR